MHVAKVVRPYKDRVYTYHFLRQTYREGRSVKHRTLANLSHLPPELIELIRRSLKGERFVAATDALRIVRSVPHGHVVAVLGLVRRLGLEALLDRRPSRQRDLATALIAARVIEPASKLATARRLADSTLAARLGVEDATEDELYGAMDWLLARQARVEAALARRHLGSGSLVLYDVSSTYMEGSHCPLARHGYSRDHRPDRAQIVFGLVTDERGCPVAVEAFSGNTADPATLETQIAKVRTRFGLSDIVLVGDRGMLTSARIARLRELGGIGWVSCLRAPALRRLVEAGDLQLGLFDERNLAEISSPEFPGERLVVCRNPALAAERARKREALLAATEVELGRVAATVERGRLRTAAAIGLRAGRVIDAKKMAKHFELDIADGVFAYRRREDAIAAEAALDGLYVVRTSVGPERLDSVAVVETYKRLSAVERDFRALKGDDLLVRPIFHWRADRVRGHLFLCLLAAHVRWHLEAAWAPLLFRDETPPARTDPVGPRRRSAGALRKERDHVTPDGLAVHSFGTLLHHLATLTENRIVPAGLDEQTAFSQLSVPTPLQERAFELLGVNAGSV
ncbi:MAG TPA: IS1634 family transposase [Candidatus Limnocylindria bacterium]|nr:IS1634 family transposase [Candidatus Limnocylindria bacterium]